MPLFGMITRVRKGLYEVVIKFVKSHRTLHVEQIGAPDALTAKRFFTREFPTLVWGKPKPPPPPKQEKVRVIKPRAKKVLRKRAKRVRRKIRNPAKPKQRVHIQAGKEL